jgi:hypothetical protein
MTERDPIKYSHIKSYLGESTNHHIEELFKTFKYVIGQPQIFSYRVIGNNNIMEGLLKFKAHPYYPTLVIQNDT